MKNLVKVDAVNDGLSAAATKVDKAEIKGKILEFAWHLKKNGYAESTITRYVQGCRTLTSLGANLLDPESVKEVIARQNWLEGTKLNYVNFYDAFAKFFGLQWQRSRYKHKAKMPFIPLEKEIDLLIHGTGKKVSILLQIIKETGMRLGEATSLRWIDVDSERNIITLNFAEKGSRNRMFRVSTQLIQRILSLPRKSEYIFNRAKKSLSSNFYVTRKRLAYEYKKDRLLQANFKSIRHWKGTIEYHKTKDIYHVNRLLGHKSLDNTLIYINLEKVIYGDSDTQEFHVKVAHNEEEACKLREVGFEKFDEFNGVHLYSKRK